MKGVEKDKWKMMMMMMIANEMSKQILMRYHSDTVVLLP